MPKAPPPEATEAPDPSPEPEIFEEEEDDNSDLEDLTAKLHWSMSV